MFFKKRDDSDVDVLEKIKEKISEDSNENSLSGDDESFLNEVLSENDLEDNEDVNNKKGDGNTLTDDEILDDINKSANEAVNNNITEQDNFEDSISDDDLLDEIDADEEEEEEKNDYNDDSFELKSDDLDLSKTKDYNNGSVGVDYSNNIDSSLKTSEEATTEERNKESVENGIENNIREVTKVVTDSNMDNKISFFNENSNNIASEKQGIDFSISRKTKDNVRNHITELIEDVKKHVSEKSNKVSLSNNDKTIAQLATEIIRPVIIKYLDVNLDKIVNDIVSSEIRKIITNINNENN